MSVVWTGDEMRQEQQRRASSKDRILAALQAAGPRGCSNADLNVISYRYGGRLHELRRAGHRIDSIHEGSGAWRFILRPAAGCPDCRVQLVDPQPATPGWLFT